MPRLTHNHAKAGLMFTVTWGFLQSPAWSATLNHEESIQAEVARVSLKNETEDDSDLVKTGTLQGRFRNQDAYSLWTGDLTYEGGSAEGSFSNLRLGTNYALLRPTRSTSFLAYYQSTEGNDLRTRPVELALSDDEDAYSSTLLGIYHQEILNPRHALGFYLSQSKNVDETYPVQSSDAFVNWDYKASVHDSYQLRLRHTRQEIFEDTVVNQSEATVSQVHHWTEHFTGEWALGYNTQKDDVESRQGVVGSVELNYRSSAPFYSGNPYEEARSLREISPEQVAELKGSSLYRLGAARSRDVRRAGDPIFYTDQIYAEALMNLGARQDLSIKASQSRAPDTQNQELAQDYESTLASLSYHYRDTIVLGSRFPQYRLGVSASQEQTRVGKEYTRTILSGDLAILF